MAVRLGRRDRAGRLLRRPGGAVADAAAAAAGLAPAARRGRQAPRQPAGRGAVRGGGRRAARRHRPRRVPRPRLGARQPRPHVHPHRRLGRDGVRQRAVRGRLPRVQPVARDPAARDPRVSGALGPLPGRDRAARVHVGRARVGLGRGAGRPDDRGRRLHGLHAGDAGAVRHRGMDAQRRGVRGLLQPVLAHLGVGDARPRRRAPAAARRPATARHAPRHGPLRRGDDRHRHVRRLQPGPVLDGRVGRPRGRPRRDRGRRRGAEGRRHDRPAGRRHRDRRLLPPRDRRRALGRRRHRRARAAARVRPHARADRDRLRRSPTT